MTLPTKKFKLPTVALIGRTNVGKSTIFNRLVDSSQRAIISKKPGTTRDAKTGPCYWNGYAFNLIDTAGLDVSTVAAIDQESVKKAEEVAKKSDLNLLIVDIHDGLLPQDRAYALMLKKLKKPLLLVINKVDGRRDLKNIGEFYELGLGDPEMISAQTGAGTGDFLDTVHTMLKSKIKKIPAPSKKPELKIAIVGKPNAGKSSLLNQLAGKNIAIVSPIAHTTRDSQDLSIEAVHEDKKITLTFIDTAGIRKHGRIDTDIEKQSVEQSLYSIRRADIILLMIDAAEPITAQDKNIAREVLEQNKSLIFVVNKWDLVEDKDDKSDQRFTDFLWRSFPYLTWAPVVYLSAKTGFKLPRLINVVLEVHDNQERKIIDKEMERFLKSLIKKQPPRKTKGTKNPYLYSIKQTSTNPQTFEIVADQADNVHFSYLRFIQNRLRERYKLVGVGIKLKLTPRVKTKSHQTK